MKGIIFYYSSTGNTELLSRYVASKINQVDFDLASILSPNQYNLDSYGIVGFAFPTFYLGVGEIVKKFINGIRRQSSKPAFLLNTFGMMQGQSLKIASGLIEGRGFKLIAWRRKSGGIESK